MSDAFDLARFVAAQDDRGTYEAALRELEAGRKRSHWMWFVFPQLEGLGRSAMAQRYGISGLAEARAYLAHPVLGPRLLDCCRALLELPASTAADDALGSVDALKLHSSLTLFALADPQGELFRALLDRFFDGRLDAGTTERL